jgi:hypothetical protein
LLAEGALQYQIQPCPKQLLLSDFFAWFLFSGLKERKKRERTKIEGVREGVTKRTVEITRFFER